ncbi:hypothetical protein ANCDUO_04049 [Ancylostoma duodenale]|uniref:Uncharacterized protein n=1 Tax=Ancylostoma duodenale TaxID=51022 RepID=A0A0C2H815_9BILA|nr:hypothetical protein ANCDUO_04049 [Ancylostoma duodenale]
MRLLLAITFYIISKCDACASTGLSRDSEIITDPTFMFTVSPPVRWTYFPQVLTTGSVQVTNFFPGQSMTSADALQAAQNEVMAAYLEALSQQPGITTLGITATVSYSPDEISNCYTGQMIPAGTKIGYLAGGAITQVAIVTGTGATATSCPLSQTMMVANIGPYQEYTKMVTVSTRGGTTMSRYNWNRVTSQFQSILNFRYQALFRTPITIGNN